jgi:hypothetical protein
MARPNKYSMSRSRLPFVFRVDGACLKTAVLTLDGVKWARPDPFNTEAMRIRDFQNSESGRWGLSPCNRPMALNSSCMAFLDQSMSKCSSERVFVLFGVVFVLSLMFPNLFVPVEINPALGRAKLSMTAPCYECLITLMTIKSPYPSS